MPQTMSSQNPTSNMLRMQEEIKRLQQLQRLRAATAGLIPSGNNMTNSMGLANSGLNESSLVNPSMNMNINMDMNCLSPTGGAGSGASNPVLASYFAKQQQQQFQQQQQQHNQQDDTRLMLLQHQLRFNGPSSTMNSSGGNPTSLQQLANSRASNLFSDLALPSPSALAQQQQQQLQFQQQLQLQQMQQQPQGVEALAARPMMRVGAIEPFPEKLHRMLMEVEQCGRGDIISFINNGRGFAIHKPDAFFKEIVPLYFRHSRLSSFKRQLNLYGFEQINIGPFRGGYYHEMFHRDNPELCRRMRRVAVKVSGATTQRKKEQEAKAKAEAERKGQGLEGEEQGRKDQQD